VRFVTAGELPSIYPDPVGTTATAVTDLAQIASRLATRPGDGLDFMVIGQRSYSAADQFELLALSVARLALKPGVNPMGPAQGLLGPDGEPPGANGKMHVKWPAFQTAVGDVVNYLQQERRIPARVFLGPDPVSPGVFLVGLAQVFAAYQQQGWLPVETGVDLPESVDLRFTQHVAQDTPGLFGGWIIHKENFRAPKVMEMARLQAWTLKPAIRAEP
jgi:hypothetical protein